MASALESKFGDLDELFAFQTGKVVVIKDRVLGLLAIALKVAILMFIIFTVVVDKGYLVIETPMGTTRMTMRMQLDDISTATLPYCANSPRGGPFPQKEDRVLECAVLQTEQAAVPSLGKQLFVTTRLTRSNPKYPCPINDFSCAASNADKNDVKTDYFVAGVEDATVMILHTIEGRGEVKVEKNLGEMNGVVKDCKGNVVKRMQKKADDASITEDIIANRIFRVEDLLKWAKPGMHGTCDTELTLDTPSGVNTVTNSSVRYDGVVLNVLLDYDNTKGDDRGEVEYEMTITAMMKADPKYVTLQSVDSEGWQVDNRHGVHIIVVQTGKLGEFSIAKLVISMTASLGLLAVAQTITDLLAKFVMPLKEEYKKIIFEYSRDFSDYRDKETPLAMNEVGQPSFTTGKQAPEAVRL